MVFWGGGDGFGYIGGGRWESFGRILGSEWSRVEDAHIACWAMELVALDVSIMGIQHV